MEEVEKNRLDRLSKLSKSNIRQSHRETRQGKMKQEYIKGWYRFLENTIFGELDTVSARSGRGYGKYRKRPDDPNKGVHLTIKRVADYLDDQGILVEMIHPRGEYRDKTWEEVLKSYNPDELLDLPIKIFDLQYIPSRDETMKASKKYKKTNKKKRKRNQKESQKGGYPQWFDLVPKGMSRKKYLRLKKTKPKNKSMKVWIKENNQNIKKSQKGGFTPCIPCLGPIFAGAGLSATGYMMSSSSSSSNINGKRSVKRKEKYQITKNGKTHKREFKQMNKRVYDGKKMSEYNNLKQANEAYNSLINKCKSKGFQKC